MFSLTKKSVYAIDIMLELIANQGKGLLQIRELSERKEIPRPFLEQILNALIKSGLVQSVRGAKGGYEVSGQAVRTSLLELLELMEGPVNLAESWQANDAVKGVFAKCEDALKDELSLTLDEVQKMQQRQKNPKMYYI